jgi:hypothetical protein
MAGGAAANMNKTIISDYVLFSTQIAEGFDVVLSSPMTLRNHARRRLPAKSMPPSSSAISS